MFTLLKLIQSLFGALHSEGTPGQLAAGIVLGSFLGLTPLVNVHNAVIFAALIGAWLLKEGHIARRLAGAATVAAGVIALKI